MSWGGRRRRKTILVKEDAWQSFVEIEVVVILYRYEEG